MPDPNQNDTNQNSAIPTITDISSADQPIVLPADHPVSPSIPPVAPLPDPVTPTTPVAIPETSVVPQAQENTPDVTQKPAEVSSFLGTTDLPPLAPDFQNTASDATEAKKTEETTNPATDSGSNVPLPDLPITTGSPKKKFGGGKIIATILGLFLLVGGIAGGVLLTQQNQNLSEKAGANDYQANCSLCQQHAPNPLTDCVSACTPPTNTCVTKNDCSPGQTCQSGHCSDTSCSAPSALVNGVCVPPGNCQHHTGNCYVTNDIGANDGNDGNNPGDYNCDGNGHWTTCAQGYTCSNEDCVPNNNRTTPPTETTPPTTPPTTPTAQCQNIKAYSSTFVLLTDAQLASLTPTTLVNFCVLGTASEGTFDKAKFTINTVVQTETTTKRPGSNDFCQSYTIPTGVTTFNVTAKIHHVTLGYK